MIQLKSCSFKGLEFAFIDAPSTGGNRVVAYNYPGSNEQTVEVQGKAPRNFSLTAVIPHEDYYRQRDSLITILEDGLAGTMIHPTFGELENVVNGGFELNENISQLGRAELTIQFYIDDAKGVPVKSSVLVSEVRAQADNVVEQVEMDIDESFSVTPTALGNTNDAVSSLAEISEGFNAALNTSNEVVEQSNEVRAKIRSFTQNARQLVNSPLVEGQKLSGAVSGIFDALTGSFDTAEQSYDAYKQLFGFGQLDAAINATTFSLIERKRNRSATRGSVNTLALTYAYVEAAKVDYRITDDLTQAQNELEEQYLLIRESGDVSNSTLEQLDRLRVLANESLDQSIVETRRVIEIETPKMPLSVLVYSYYGNTDLFHIISELNDIKGNQAVEGKIRILSA